jgi:hypothetical protein
MARYPLPDDFMRRVLEWLIYRDDSDDLTCFGALLSLRLTSKHMYNLVQEQVQWRSAGDMLRFVGFRTFDVGAVWWKVDSVRRLPCIEQRPTCTRKRTIDAAQLEVLCVGQLFTHRAAQRLCVQRPPRRLYSVGAQSGVKRKSPVVDDAVSLLKLLKV